MEVAGVRLITGRALFLSVNQHQNIEEICTVMTKMIDMSVTRVRCLLFKVHNLIIRLNQSVNESNLAFVKRHLNKVLRGASYDQACTKSQVLRPDLNCSRLLLMFLR